MEKNIKIFYHVYLINNYQNIISEQLKIIHSSELYNECKNIYIGVVGGEEERKWLIELTRDYSKIEFHFFDNGDEKNTLRLIPILSHSEDYILYFHTKGVTKEPATCESWRELLNYKVIYEWKKCVEELDKGNDCVGPLYREETIWGYFPHFSGNFWWAKFKHILTLDNSYLNENYIHGRMGAEFWIGSNPSAKMKCIYKFDSEPYYKKYNINE